MSKHELSEHPNAESRRQKAEGTNRGLPAPYRLLAAAICLLSSAFLPGRASNSSPRLSALAGVALALIALGGWLVVARGLEADDGRWTTDDGVSRAPSSPHRPSSIVHRPGKDSSLPTSGSTATTRTYPNGIAAGRSYKNDLSPLLRDLKPAPNKPKPRQSERENPPILIPGYPNSPDPVVQRTFGSLAPLLMPTPINNFDGISFPGYDCYCAPPDTNGEVGLTQYVQIVNKGFQVWNKSGVSLYGPTGIGTLWSGFGGVCETSGAGDPVVMYDQLANRWLISQFAANNGSITDECIAISTTGDATGSYFRYGFHMSENFFDYPHFGVWPDAYYLSANIFNTSGTQYLGPQPFAFDRAQMLSGQPASFQSTIAPLGGSVWPVLPADQDGPTPPPAGSPNYFQGFGNPIPLYRFHVDWDLPANSSFTNSANLAAAGFTELCPGIQNCIPQSGTTETLDGLGDRPMFRLAYRNFGDHEALVSNHSVDVGGGQAGVRWYEIRNPGGSPSIFQQGSYAPDSTSRWMGSIAMDKNGDLAIGYSASSSSIFPAIRYAGRLATDPLGQLSQGETTLFAGTGSQVTTGNRWGDYSDLTVDPADDCTFWYTGEYYQTTSSFNWRTRIGSFKFPSCVGGTPTPTRTGTPPTATRTVTPHPPTATPTASLTPASCGISSNYAVSQSTGASIVPGATDIGNHDDDLVTTIFLPFTYQFYGANFTIVSASSNGNLQFSSANNDFQNACLPTENLNNAILPHWGDLRTDGAGNGIFTSISGSAPNRIFNIEWRAYYYGTTTSVNFEVRLYENASSGSRFDIIYGAVPEGGSNATVGAQRGIGPQFTQFECTTPGSLVPSMRLTFIQPPCAPTTPTLSPTATRTATPATTPAAMLIGHLTWQGIVQPDPRNATMTGTLTLCAGGSPLNYVVTTDASGFFTVTTGLPPGSYNWYFKGPRNLANNGSVVLSAGATQTELDIMRAGDCNNSNIVEATDFIAVKNAFGKSSGQPGYDPRADFNNDNSVTSVDFTLMKGNFGQAGASPNCP